MISGEIIYGMNLLNRQVSLRLFYTATASRNAPLCSESAFVCIMVIISQQVKSPITARINVSSHIGVNARITADTEPENETDNPESMDDDFTAEDAFIIGVAFGFGYEEGLRERKRKKRKKYIDDSD